MDKVSIGNKICTVRKQLEMTQKQLADKLHVSDKAVSKWERGLNYPDLELLENIAEALDMSLSELLDIQDETVDATFKEFSEISAEEKKLIKRELKKAIIGNVVFLVCLLFTLNIGFRMIAFENINREIIGTTIAVLGGGSGIIIGNSIRVVKKLGLL